jgi:hypothetical protein
MSHWKLHPFCFFCYNCNQQLVKFGQGNNWGCPLCDFLDLTKGNEYGHWEFGECPRCNNSGLETMRCVTCSLNLGNTITFLALKVALKKYVDEPELLTRDEFAIWAKYFHYLDWRPGIVCYGMCCMRDLQLRWNHVSWFTGRVLHSWGTRCERNRMS